MAIGAAMFQSRGDRFGSKVRYKLDLEMRPQQSDSSKKKPARDGRASLGVHQGWKRANAEASHK
jgi:hypothetical protein